ncbi:MAG TPA: Asp-tRNA(Asn)/Glu-tRNA(Gln) amidotransferase GatCAB subunit C [Clostridiales bacterium]|nr:Asp-tRNA(Asn)/Glu-tRNA(Gln) amidotransferase GatCAB subunit C [Clostridiales bacterium]
MGKVFLANTRDEKEEGGVFVKVDENTIRYLAGLAKLEFSGEETTRLAEEFQKIFDHFENISRTYSKEMDEESEPVEESVLRKDKVKPFGSRQELFRNAKPMRNGFLVVPKVLEQEKK